MIDGEGWSRVVRALSVFAVDPEGLGGAVIRGRTGPVMTTVDEIIAGLPGAQRRIHTGLTDLQLFGGLDIAGSIAAGRAVTGAGLAAAPCRLVLPMAERTPPDLAARLAQLLDRGRHSLVLCDEGAGEDEGPPACLAERLAMHLELEGIHWSATSERPDIERIASARSLLPLVAARDDDAAALTLLAARFGIPSLRAPLLALRAARALAALDGRLSTADEDIAEAAGLVFPSRATHLPEDDDSDNAEPRTQEAEPESHAQQDSTTPEGLPLDMLIDAVAAHLPDRLLEGLRGGTSAGKTASGAGAGSRRKSNCRGRPLPSRPGRPDGRSRIDVVATLRAAAPWQRLRNRSGERRLILIPSDLRFRRYEDRSDRLLVFVVDASGSAAMARLAEAKGAVQLLLAQAYAERDHVALIAFRKTDAEVLLPPTRSLVQAKRRLADLAGGGGTPLASGLAAALELALQSRSRGLSPALVILTDGRANVALSGEPGRSQSNMDAMTVAAQIRQTRLAGLMIDSGARPGEEGRALALGMGLPYVAMPRSDAGRISAAVTDALS